MELYDVLRTTFAAREFTADPLPDEVLAKILDQARFAPSGGNRQGWRVIVIRDPASKRALADLSAFAGRRYAAQAANGESPWNTIDPPRVDAATIERTAVPSRLTESIATAPVVLVLCVDLKVVASIDQDLERVGIISGASIYPFAWNVLLASRHEGFGLPVVEAFACGVPVVATAAPAIAEVAADAAVLVPVDEVTALADAVRKVLADPSLAESLRARGLVRAAQFRWAVAAVETLSVYEEVLGEPFGVRSR